ncbi:MAG: response regulator transcription factor [Polyangiaceae bacterium]
MSNDRVLLVDDEPDLSRLVAFNLKEAGFDVVVAATAGEGLAKAHAERPLVAILDVMLPDFSGIELLTKMRADDALSDVGILMLTARGDEQDRVAGFEQGADDYVVKPFSVKELVLRVRALARRSHERQAARAAAPSSQQSAPLKWRGLAVDVASHRVYLDGQEVLLRPLEFKLITVLLERPTHVFSRAQLLEEVWGTSGEINTRTVDTHVRRLRDKLGALADAVETVHGFGYRLRAEREA